MDIIVQFFPHKILEPQQQQNTTRVAFILGKNTQIELHSYGGSIKWDCGGKDCESNF